MSPLTAGCSLVMTNDDMKRLALLWLLPLALLAYAAIASAYPYYATWDSTQVYTLDALIAGAGQVPDHIFHPNVVPLVLERYVFLPLGELAGWISTSSITELGAAPNPYLPFAETAEYLVRVGYVYALVFLAFMYLTIFRLLEPQLSVARGRLAGFLALTLTALALVWKLLPFMLIWVRYETAGLALWSVALYAAVRAAKEPGKRRWIVLTGLFSGAAVMSKVLLAGGVAILPFLYAFLLDEAPSRPGRKERWACAALAVGVAALLAVVHGLAYVAFKSHALPRVAFDTKLGSMSLAPIAPGCAAILACATLVVMRFSERWPRLAALTARGVIFCAAFSSVLLIALAVGTTWDERTGALYWTYIFSYGFGQLAVGDATGYLKPVVWSRCAIVFGVCALAVAAVAIGYARSRARMSRARLLAGIAAVVIAVLAIAALTRPSLRKDGMLFIAWATLASLVAWRMLLALYDEKRLLLMGCAVIWLSVGCQIAGLADFHKTQYTGGDYDYVPARWKSFNYGHRGKAYGALMRRAYPDEARWRTAFRWSLEIPGTKLLLAQVFRDRDVRLIDTALAFEGGALRAGGAERIGAISPQLGGALLVAIGGGRVGLGVRADYDFYYIGTGPPKAVDGKRPTATKYRFETAEKGAAARAHSVYRLVPGNVTLDLGGGSATIAIVDGNAAATCTGDPACTR
jgi:hypothetical protein